MDPLLFTKYQSPPVLAECLERPRLVENLSAQMQAGARLTMISAPAGYGKTTLLASWLSKMDIPVAWISLEEQDNEGDQFFRYLRAAFDEAGLELGTGQTGFERSRVEAPMPLIRSIHSIVRNARPPLLVLDNFHTISSPAIHSALLFLLDHQPNQLHVVIGTPGDPPLPIARFRARGLLSELRTADLRFKVQETRTFLNDVQKFALTDVALQALVERTEGWNAGLMLAALSIRGRSDTEVFIVDLKGNQRFILEFFMEKVLDQQPAPVQEFLLRVCLLGILVAPLCDAVLGMTGIQVMFKPAPRISAVAGEAYHLYVDLRFPSGPPLS